MKDRRLHFIGGYAWIAPFCVALLTIEEGILDCRYASKIVLRYLYCGPLIVFRAQSHRIIDVILNYLNLVLIAIVVEF